MHTARDGTNEQSEPIGYVIRCTNHSVRCDQPHCLRRTRKLIKGGICFSSELRQPCGTRGRHLVGLGGSIKLFRYSLANSYKPLYAVEIFRISFAPYGAAFASQFAL